MSLRGSLGAYIFYSTNDYVVPVIRQHAWGTRADVEVTLRAKGGLRP
jgi:hypothetical protein